MSLETSLFILGSGDVMEFGHIEDISQVDWSLIKDPLITTEFLRTLPRKSKTSYFLGTPAWGHKEWINIIYPPKTKASDFLHHYSRRYQCIELNTSHYRIPTPEQTVKWIKQVPAHFIFCPKVFQGISHGLGGLSDAQLFSQWIDFLEALGTHCGPSFLQLPPYFDYSRKAELHAFLKRWPDDKKLALEFRHPSWFQDHQILPPLAEYLQKRHIGLVILDVAGRRDLVHSTITAPFTMIRFIGNDLDPSDERRMVEWAKKLKVWSDQGLQDVFFFIHEPDDLLAPQMTQVVIKHLNQQAQAGLRPLDLGATQFDSTVGSTPSLFETGL